MSEDTSWFNIILLFFIVCLALGVIWVIASTMGQFLAAPYWLLIIGGIGLFGIYLFAKNRE